MQKSASNREGKGGKEMLACKPHNKKPIRPQTEFPDWRSMAVLIAK